MSTIADTLNDLQAIQHEMQQTIEEEADVDDFIRGLFAFTTARLFDLCAHAVLETLRNPVEALRHPYAEKYYSLFDQRPVLNAQILWSNHSGLFSLWNMFELFVKRSAESMGLDNKVHLDKLYKNVLGNRGFQGAAYQRIFEEFEVMRITRNSLHNGGNYDRSKARQYHFRGELYSFDPGRPVKPLRLVDVVQTMWEHYQIITVRT